MKKNVDGTLSASEQEILVLLQHAFEAGANAKSGNIANSAWEHAESALKKAKGEA